ncbi:helix-turn-helix transcriptional regulator [Rhodanobacter sp. UC4436_H3]
MKTRPLSSDSASLALAAARFIDELDSESFLSTAFEAISSIVSLDNFIVFAYRQEFVADLVHSNLDLKRLGSQMKPYTNGLYMLDPFYVAETQDHRRGLLRLDEVAPEDFRESEFYLTFYTSVGVLDELHYVILIEPGRSVHLFMERELPSPKFSSEEIRRLEVLEPMVASAVRRHWAWRDRVLSAQHPSPIQSAGGIDGVIRNMRPEQITPREVEVIGLSLRGYSSKLIADQLGISEGTVTNHKRNVYDKLGIHSQSQLFSLFLDTLTNQPHG